MAQLAKLIDLEQFRSERQETVSTQPSSVEVLEGSSAAIAVNVERRPPLTDFYPENDEIAAAQQLLSESTDLILQAIEALDAGDQLSSDDYLSRLQTCLDELFAFRDFGDGFATVVLALMMSCRHRRTQFLSRWQLVSIESALRSIVPFISLEAALERVSELEERGLVVDPPELDSLADAQ